MANANRSANRLEKYSVPGMGFSKKYTTTNQLTTSGQEDKSKNLSKGKSKKRLV